MAEHGYTILGPKNGRRRGNRRWPEGETTLPADEMTDELLEALLGDPGFVVVPPGAPVAPPVVEPVPVAPTDEEVAAAIRALGRDDFTKNGEPKMDAIRAGFGKAEGKLIGPDQRLRVFDEMKSKGFEAPSE